MPITVPPILRYVTWGADPDPVWVPPAETEAEPEKDPLLPPDEITKATAAFLSNPTFLGKPQEGTFNLVMPGMPKLAPSPSYEVEYDYAEQVYKVIATLPSTQLGIAISKDLVENFKDLELIKHKVELLFEEAQHEAVGASVKSLIGSIVASLTKLPEHV